jgi:hypothetical protein
MPGSQMPYDLIFQHTKVLSSSIATDPATGRNEGILLNISGVGGVDFESSTPTLIGDDDQGEGDDQAEAFGQLGFLARPLPPSGEHHAEALSLRSGDGFTPVAYRDTRLRMQGNGPNVGCIAFTGYGGGFFSQSPNLDSNGDPISTIQVLYCPYDYNSAGIAQKAHTIILDPSSGNESVSVIHSSGMAITMIDGQLVLKNRYVSPSETPGVDPVSLVIGDNGIEITGNVTIGGSLVLGNPSTAVPLAASPSVLACPNFLYSPA